MGETDNVRRRAESRAAGGAAFTVGGSPDEAGFGYRQFSRRGCLVAAWNSTLPK